MSDLIPPADLLIEPAQRTPEVPQGGQHAGVSPGIMITHLPTGLIAYCHNDRSQHRNRAICIAMIEGALTCPEWRG